MLKNFADEIDFTMKLDSKCLEETLHIGDEAAKIAPIHINADKIYCKYSPYEYIYGRYEVDKSIVDDKLYWRPGGMKTPFRSKVRLTLIGLLIERSPPGGGACLKLNR